MFTLENFWDYKIEDKKIENTFKEYEYRKGMGTGNYQKERQILINMLNNNSFYNDLSKVTGIDGPKIKDYL